MIGVARPTRGLEFTESAQSIERNLHGWDHVVERSWDKPIPESFNHVTRLLLSYAMVNYIWFVEEDVVVPDGTIDVLLDLNVDIAALSYPLKVDGRISEARDDQDKILWVSMGCTLVRRCVFEKVADPWFRSGYLIASIHDGSSSQRKRYELVPGGKNYGNHDAYLCWLAREAGFRLGVVEGVLAVHLILDEMGKPQQNDGCHKIRRVQLRTGGDYAVRA